MKNHNQALIILLLSLIIQLLLIKIIYIRQLIINKIALKA